MVRICVVILYRFIVLKSIHIVKEFVPRRTCFCEKSVPPAPSYRTGSVCQIRSAYSITARSAANRSAFAMLVMDMPPQRMRSA